MGKEGKYDLKLADPPPMTETESDSESEVVSEDNVANSEVLTPSKLIRKGIIQSIKFLSILFGMEAEHIPSGTARNFSSFLRNVIDKGYKKNELFDPGLFTIFVSCLFTLFCLLFQRTHVHERGRWADAQHPKQEQLLLRWG